MKTKISKQDAIKYLERKSFPGWDACSDEPAVSFSDAEYLIDLIYSHGNCKAELGNIYENKELLEELK